MTFYPPCLLMLVGAFMTGLAWYTRIYFLKIETSGTREPIKVMLWPFVALIFTILIIISLNLYK